MVSTRVLLSSPYFWGILTLLAAAAVIATCVWLLKYCCKLILPEDYNALKDKFGAPLKSMEIMIKRVPLPEPVRFWENCYIHLTAPATVSDFTGELPLNGVPVGLEIVLTEELNESIKNIMGDNQNV